MSEKLDKLRATFKKEQERRIKLNNRIAVLERRIQEEEAAEVKSGITHIVKGYDMFRHHTG